MASSTSSINKSLFENKIHSFLSFLIQGYNTQNKDKYKIFFETFIRILEPSPYNNLLKQYIIDNPIIDAILLTRQSFFLWLTRLVTTNIFTNESERTKTELDIINSLNIKSEDIDPHIWGRIAWTVLLHIIELYSDSPTDDMKSNYKIILTNLQYVLPCHTCRNNYVVELKNNNITDTVLQDKQSLLLWYTCLKNNVNNRVLLARNLGGKSFLPELAGITSYHYEHKQKLQITQTPNIQTPQIPKQIPKKITYQIPVKPSVHYGNITQKTTPYTLYSKSATGSKGCGCGKK